MRAYLALCALPCFSMEIRGIVRGTLTELSSAMSDDLRPLGSIDGAIGSWEYTDNMCDHRWDSARLAPDGTEQGGNSQSPHGVKPTT